MQIDKRKETAVMKVCIIGQADKQYLPYVNRYTEFFKRHNIPYDIIYWQQEEHAPLSESNEFYFTKPLKGGFFEKWSRYLQYRKYVLSILEKENYDRIILLTTLPCFLLRKYLLKNYKYDSQTHNLILSNHIYYL